MAIFFDINVKWNFLTEFFKAKIDQYQRKLSIVNLNELECNYLEIIRKFYYYSNFYENVTLLRNLVKFCEFLSKSIMERNAAA